jgi:hypothetical protein
MDISRKIGTEHGFWHVLYLLVFYLSTTFSLLFIYIAIRAQHWVRIEKGDIGRYFLNGTSFISKNFLLIMSIFFILNTLYLIKKRD